MYFAVQLEDIVIYTSFIRHEDRQLRVTTKNTKKGHQKDRNIPVNRASSGI